MESSANPNSSISVSEKRVSQWDDLMRKFSRAHEQECRQTKLKIPQARRSTKMFPTGSQYEGSWDILGMSGFGKYTFPNGVIYEGDFEDGMFHGAGHLQYPDGTIVKGTFKRGVITNRKLIFVDGLIYEEDDWAYCKMPDRRYTEEYDNGLQPAGRSNITAEMPPRDIPPGYYDTGDGFYDPKTKSVYKADDLSIMLRSPSEHEQKWIVDNCRTAPETVLGPRVDLYEEWMEPQLKLPHPPPPAAPTAQTSMLRKRSTHSTASSTDTYDTFSSQRPHRLSTYHGYQGSTDSSIEQNVPNAPKITDYCNAADKVKNNTTKDDTQMSIKFSTVSNTYNDVFNQEINVALATLFKNPKDPVFKNSDNTYSNLDKIRTQSETCTKSNGDLQVKTPALSRIYIDDDMLQTPGQRFENDDKC